VYHLRRLCAPGAPGEAALRLCPPLWPSLLPLPPPLALPLPSPLPWPVPWPVPWPLDPEDLAACCQCPFVCSRGGLPGGTRCWRGLWEVGEAFEEAVAREVLEEAGVVVAEGSVRSGIL